MPQKLRDISVKVGEYTNSQGERKGRWQRVGALMRGDEGGDFILLARWFNPAGVVSEDENESVLLSCFKPNEEQAPPARSKRQARRPARQAAPAQDDLDDDLDEPPY